MQQLTLLGEEMFAHLSEYWLALHLVLLLGNPLVLYLVLLQASPLVLLLGFLLGFPQSLCQVLLLSVYLVD